MTSAILIKGEGTYPKPEVRRIYPSKRLLWKYLSVLFLIWIIFIIVFGGVIYVVTSIPQLNRAIELRNIFFFIFFIFTLLIFVPIAFIIPLYIRKMEYLVHGDEIIIKKGLFNRTVKYIPYRTVTDLSTTAGPIDRLFKIGNINIETAGMGGGLETDSEEILEGLFLYNEIMDYILKRLRAFQSLQTGEDKKEDLKNNMNNLQREALIVLKEIKTLLESKFSEENE